MSMDRSQVSLLLVAGVGLAAPLLWAAMGELVSEIAGVINIELEGMMLSGAFCGVLGAHISGNLVVGLLFASMGGVLFAVVHGVVCFVFDANQIVSGVVLNVLALGATAWALSVVFPAKHVSVHTVGPLRIPGLSDIPVVGAALFDQNWLVYLGGLLVPASWWFLNRTAAGLRVQAAGERAEAAESLGVDVVKVRWLALLGCGVLAGIGGAQLTLAGVGTFTTDITAGQGFIVLAAVVFGRWKPLGTLVAVMVFGIAEALSIRGQALGIHIPTELLLMLPYVVTVLAVAGMVRRMRPPTQLGVNFQRD